MTYEDNNNNNIINNLDGAFKIPKSDLPLKKMQFFILTIASLETKYFTPIYFVYGCWTFFDDLIWSNLFQKMKKN
jgi:hypothetical protein